MDAAAPPDTILASSSSGLTMDVLQSACKHPERCVIGHPFNPPHIIPLVEVVGGAKTSEQTIVQAMEFYASIGKKPIRLNKALPGHVANRFHAALYKEVLFLVQQGVSVSRMLTPRSATPGTSLGHLGPSQEWHLGGGPGGIRHYMDHLMNPLAELIGTLAAGMAAASPDSFVAISAKLGSQPVVRC
jgi:carnitine 3-dehydrogenase